LENEPPQPDWLLATLHQELKGLACPGIVAGYIDTGNTPRVASVGIRQIGTALPLQITDGVHIGSCTKALTGLLIGDAITARQLRFSTTLGALDSLWKKSPWADQTIESVLRHEAGLPENVKWWDIARTGGDLTIQRRDVLNPRWRSGSKMPTAGKFSYSNVGYVVLGSVIDKLYGMPYEDVLQLRIARPKLLQSVGFGVPSLVSGHQRTATSYVPTTMDNPPVMNSAGRMHISMGDWLKSATLHMASSSFMDSTVRRSLQESRKDGGYAGGWIVVSRSWAAGPALTHAGSNTFWMAVMWVAPNTWHAFAAVANSAGDDVAKGLDRIISAMILRSQHTSR
jgi:CubicO group peptidase (beta-lactamase class C family)